MGRLQHRQHSVKPGIHCSKVLFFGGGYRGSSPLTIRFQLVAFKDAKQTCSKSDALSMLKAMVLRRQIWEVSCAFLQAGGQSITQNQYRSQVELFIMIS